MDPPPPEAGRLRPPQQRSRVFWNTEPLLRNGERKVSDEFSLRPTRDPSARRRKLTPDAKHPSGHPRLRRPKGALCSPIVRHGFANQHEAQMETVPVGDIKPPELKPQTDAINSDPSRPHEKGCAPSCQQPLSGADRTEYASSITTSSLFKESNTPSFPAEDILIL